MDGHQDAVPITLPLLPEEVLLVVARICLAAQLPAAVRLATQTCRLLCTGLQPVLVEASARRLQWLPLHTMRHAVSDDGRQLTKTHANGHDCACAAGPMLPTAGKSAWRLRIVHWSADSDPFIGVCDASGRSEWGLDLCKGTLVHLKRNHKGQIVQLGDNRGSCSLGDAACLRGRRPAIIEVIVDHDRAQLSFRVNGGATTRTVSISSAVVDLVTERDGRRGGGQVDAVDLHGSLAKGIALRPYASLGLARSAHPDRVSFCDGYVYTPC